MARRKSKGRKRSSGSKKKTKSGSGSRPPARPCPAKELKNLVVYDTEDSGNRHYDRMTAQLHIVQTDTKDPVTFHYTGPNPPNPMVVHRDGTELDPASPSSRAGGSAYNLDVQFYPKEDPYGDTVLNLLQALFTFASPVTTYTVVGFPRTVTIKAYNPDQWKLTIQLPPFRGLKMGAVLDNQESARVVTGDRAVAVETKKKKSFKIEGEVSDWKKTSTAEFSSTYERKTAALATPRLYAYAATESFKVEAKAETKDTEVPPDEALSLVRNGTLMEFDVVKLVSSVLKIVTDITGAVKAFKDYAPKVGWYIDFDLKVFEGKLEIFWGWKEADDYRVFYHLGVAADITLVEVMLEIGFGVEVARIGGQVCVQFKGGISMQVGVETVGPTAEDMDLGKISGTIEAGGYVRAGAGDIIKVEGGIKSSITCEAGVKVKFGSGLELKGENKWDGLTVVCSAETMFGWKTSKDIPLVDPMVMGTWDFPAAAEPDPTECESVLEVSTIAEGVVTEGWNLRVFKETVETKQAWFSGKEYADSSWEQLTSEQVADMIALKIWAKKEELLLDPKTVKSLAQSVRKKCDVIASKGSWRDWMSQAELEKFLKSGEFTQILEDARDPAKDLKKKISKKK